MRFTEILFAATLLSGFIWLFDILFLRPRRMMRVMPGKNGIQEPMLVEYAKAFFPILLIVLVVRSFIVEPFRIPSGSMRPTLLEGDFIVVNKFDYGFREPLTGAKLLEIRNPKRGEVIVFRHMKNDESIDMIKRVVGLPGDKIEYKDNIIYVNGTPVKQEFQKEATDKDVVGLHSWPVKHNVETLGDIRHDIYIHSEPTMRKFQFDDVTVPANSYFVMGDNRDNSDDSRGWGFVKDEDVLGRAMGIWMSWDASKTGLDCLSECIRWNRIGNNFGTPTQNAE